MTSMTGQNKTVSGTSGSDLFREQFFDRFLNSPWPLLKPVGAFWGWLMALRRQAYGTGLLTSTLVEKPVLSVGNLTLGGNSKTPMCIFLARELAKKGFTAAILSRGYGRKAVKAHPEPLFVSRGQGPLLSVQESGDEPFLMAQKTQAMVVLAKKRVLAARLAIDSGADVLVLDDGFQHLSLKRDLDILMLQANQDFSKDFVIPAGYLRERAETHRKADIFVVIGQELNNYISKLASGRPVFLAKMLPSRFVRLNDGQTIETKELRDKRLAAFCGLARPSSFFKSISEMKLTIQAHLCLEDHVSYQRGVLSRLKRFKELNRADFLLTSAKDAVKLPPSLPLPIITLESDLILDRPEEFISETLSRLKQLSSKANYDD
ncbi:MAG: tetraacyldisaccharide 4'-kinase [Deltaproteobacteria bacterium]|jgi:tetraacyldisaccharide 4'-kinase|nr:tetraacyldisaccharide 4'-kinase [Deltaproteobacteria bacterium]